MLDPASPVVSPTEVLTDTPQHVHSILVFAEMTVECELVFSPTEVRTACVPVPPDILIVKMSDKLCPIYFITLRPLPQRLPCLPQHTPLFTMTRKLVFRRSLRELQPPVCVSARSSVAVGLQVASYDFHLPLAVNGTSAVEMPPLSDSEPRRSIAPTRRLFTSRDPRADLRSDSRVDIPQKRVLATALPEPLQLSAESMEFELTPRERQLALDTGTQHVKVRRGQSQPSTFICTGLASPSAI